MRRAFAGGFLGSLLQPLLTRLGLKLSKGVLVGLVVVVALFVRWWQEQPTWVHLLVVVVVAGLLLRAPLRNVVRLPNGRVVEVESRPVRTEPTQVLYRYYEPDDLAPGQQCYCGKPRTPGELVYVGITRAGRARELDEDRRQACWWGPGLVGMTETYSTRDEVEAAEVRAIRTEAPRENVQHAGAWA